MGVPCLQCPYKPGAASTSSGSATWGGHQHLATGTRHTATLWREKPRRQFSGNKSCFTCIFNLLSGNILGFSPRAIPSAFPRLCSSHQAPELSSGTKGLPARAHQGGFCREASKGNLQQHQQENSWSPGLFIACKTLLEVERAGTDNAFSVKSWSIILVSKQNWVHFSKD